MLHWTYTMTVDGLPIAEVDCRAVVTASAEIEDVELYVIGSRTQWVKAPVDTVDDLTADVRIRRADEIRELAQEAWAGEVARQRAAARA